MKEIKWLLLFWILTLLWIGGSFAYNSAFLSYTNSSWTNHYYTNMISSSLIWWFVNSNWVKFAPYNQTIWCQTNVSTTFYFANYFVNRAILIPLRYCNSTKIWNPTISNSSSVSYYYINSWNDSLDFNYLHLFYLSSRDYYDDYFFLTSSYLYSLSWQYLDIRWWLSRKKVFPWINKSYSSISISNWQSEDFSLDYFEFSFVPEDWFQDWWLYNITWILVFHNNFYSNWYLSWTNTLILFKDDSNIYYNLYDEYTDSLLILATLTPSSKWILYSSWVNAFDDFKSFVFNSWLLVEPSFWGSILNFNSINKELDYNNRSFLSSFTYQSDNSVSNWFDFINWDWWGWNQYTWNWTISLSWCVDTELCTYTTWSDWSTLKLCHTSCVSQDVIDSWGYISYDWTYYFVNTPLSLDDLKNSDLTFSTWYLDSWGILDPVFFEDLFDPTKKAVWVCPFPYYSWPLDFLSNIWFDWVYLFMPLICFYSAFQHWAHLSYFDDPNIITWGVLSSPLFHWNSENHRIFFMFLDVLLSIGLLWLFHHLSSLL